MNQKKPKKSDAIKKFQNKISEIENLKGSSLGSPQFKKWDRDVEVLIEYTFGKDNRYLREFRDIDYTPIVFFMNTSEAYDTAEDLKAYHQGLSTAKAMLMSMVDEIKQFWPDEIASEDLPNEKRAYGIIEVTRISERFHSIARQLRSRYSDRPELEIEDEYDVQYLYHALLKMYFDDIREEESAPSHAGANSRVDFLLKSEQIVVEIKKTRKGLNDRKLGEELMIDIQRYQAHPDCKTLICFIYDPEGRISNPKGLKNDLEKTHDSLPVILHIYPE